MSKEGSKSHQSLAARSVDIHRLIKMFCRNRDGVSVMLAGDQRWNSHNSHVFSRTFHEDRHINSMFRPSLSREGRCRSSANTSMTTPERRQQDRDLCERIKARVRDIRTRSLEKRDQIKQLVRIKGSMPTSPLKQKKQGPNQEPLKKKKFNVNVRKDFKQVQRESSAVNQTAIGGSSIPAKNSAKVQSLSTLMQKTSLTCYSKGQASRQHQRLAKMTKPNPKEKHQAPFLGELTAWEVEDDPIVSIRTAKK